MREKNYNTGLRGVLFDAKHYAQMGPALWLYGWLVLRQTHQTGTIGWVLGGAPIRYREIEEETGFNRRTLERWMQMLRRHKYIDTAVVDSGISIRILRAKKHLQPKAEIKGVRRIAGSVRGFAEGLPQRCVGSASEKAPPQQVSARIGSSSLVRINTKQHTGNSEPVERVEKFSNQADRTTTGLILEQPEHLKMPTQNDTQNPWLDQKNERGHVASEKSGAQQNFSWDLRERMRLIRAEREEALRRELAAGGGPEVRHHEDR